MIDSSTNTLFHLLRSALEAQSAEGLPSDVDWQKVIDMLFNQGVAAIAVDGLGFAHDNDDDNDNKEGAELALDSPELEDLKYEWFGATFQAEEDYSNTVKAAEALANKFPIVILKGLSIARKYSIPAHRESVDLDIFGLRAECLETELRA